MVFVQTTLDSLNVERQHVVYSVKNPLVSSSYKRIISVKEMSRVTAIYLALCWRGRTCGRGRLTRYRESCWSNVEVFYYCWMSRGIWMPYICVLTMEKNCLWSELKIIWFFVRYNDIALLFMLNFKFCDISKRKTWIKKEKKIGEIEEFN